MYHIKFNKFYNLLFYFDFMSFEDDLLKVNENIRKYSGNEKGNLISDRDLKRLKRDTCPEAVSYLETFLTFSDFSKILEIGCGQAKTINDLAKRNKNKIFYGIDISLDKFKLKKRPNVYLKLCDANNLDFSDSSIDLVYSFMTFPYILDKLRALREIYRVLRPDGIAIIDSPPEYFYPSAKKIIPYHEKNSDIFWADFSDDFILIKKKGKGAECLNKEYLSFSYFPWDNCYVNPVLSIYE